MSFFGPKIVINAARPVITRNFSSYTPFFVGIHTTNRESAQSILKNGIRGYIYVARGRKPLDGYGDTAVEIYSKHPVKSEGTYFSESEAKKTGMYALNISKIDPSERDFYQQRDYG